MADYGIDGAETSDCLVNPLVSWFVCYFVIVRVQCLQPSDGICPLPLSVITVPIITIITELGTVQEYHEGASYSEVN
jgi:hypothetical protein